MDDILQVNERLRGLIWGAPMLILLLGTGLYFTVVTGVFQVRYCALWLRKTLFSCFTGAARRTSGGVSPFAAMCTALAATVGTGNIAGVTGAIFVGEWTAEAVGDYVAGPNHTLPTGGTARFSSPLSVDDFVKKSSVICYSAEALASDADAVITIAHHEGLWAHAHSVELRKEIIDGKAQA